MKKFRLTVLILLIFVFITFNSSVFSRFSSRIEGIVTDKETGDTIPKAWVLLYRVDEGIVKTTQTDEKGYFKFGSPPVFAGKEYFIRCTSPGYAQYIPEYYAEYVKPGYFDEIFRPFRIEEGQIKHIRINLEKGGSLKGVLFKKDSTGISPFQGVTVFLRKKKKPNEYFLKDTNDNERFRLGYTKTDERGGFIFHELEPSDDSIQDEYAIQLVKSGYHNMDLIKDIKIKKGDQSYIEHTVIFPDQPELKGTIKINGKNPIRGNARLYVLFPGDEDKVYTYGSNFDENGNYFFYGIPSGKYELVIEAYYSWDREAIGKMIVDIIKGKTSIHNFNLGVEQ